MKAADATGQDRSRFPELDALRGLAATAVVFSHASSFLGIEGADLRFSEHPAAYLIRHSPLHIFWSGRNSVILFFVLSGFVLSLPWLRARPQSFRTFTIRRICRIWAPYIVAAAFALFLRALLFRPDARLVQSDAWTGRLTPATLLNIVSLVGYFDPSAFDMATWSLAHEMRISLLFPLLMAFVAGRRWFYVLGSAFAVSVASGAIRKIVNPALPTDIWDTIHYAAFFAVGFLVAAHRAALCRIVTGSASWLLAGLGLYTYSSWFFPQSHALHSVHTDDWFIAAGSSLLILAALGDGSLAGMLRQSWARWLGDVSYSLYLYHVPLFLAFLYGLHGLIAPAGAVILALPAILIVSAASRQWVEVPAISLGRKLTSLPDSTGDRKNLIPA